MLSVLSGLLAAIDPLLMRRLIDVELPEHRVAQALFLVLVIAGCLLGQFTFLVASLYLNFTAEQDFAQNLRIGMLEQLNRLSAEYHEETPAGDKLSRLERDVDQIAELGADITSSSLRSIIFLAINIAVMVRLNTMITLAILPSLGVFVWLTSRFRSPLQQQADLVQSRAGRASSVLLEYLSALPQIQLLCAENLAVRKAVSALMGMLQARKSQRRTELRYAGTVNVAAVLATFLVLTVGSVQVSRGVLTIGGLVAFYAYATRVFEPVSSIMEVYSRVQKVGASIRRVRAMLERPSTVPDLGKVFAPRPRINHGISVSNVTYCYKGDRPALQDVSLDLAPAGCLGIVGRSGSGKSTLARLLARVSDPQRGEITLDGYPLRDFALSALRQMICYVSQKPILFDGSVRENLLYGSSQATPSDLERVTAITQLTSVLGGLPSGLDTPIGPSGHSLSGGEAQRVALARALLREAPVLILDESTSALDVPTEQLVLASIADDYSDSILVIISHRVASIAWMERIVVFDGGRITASGTHNDLYAESESYRRLYESNLKASINS